MARKQLVTPAIRVLRAAGIDFMEHSYRYVPGGGALEGAKQLGLDAHRVIKTLIVESSGGDPVCVLMHGDSEVSLKGLARQLGHKSMAMAPPAAAERHSGYQVGGTSPFGMRTAMTVCCERTIAEFERVVINGGKRGFLVELAFADLAAVLHPQLVDVAI